MSVIQKQVKTQQHRQSCEVMLGTNLFLVTFLAAIFPTKLTITEKSSAE